MKLTIKWFVGILIGLFSVSCFVTKEWITIGEVVSLPSMGSSFLADLQNKGTSWRVFVSVSGERVNGSSQVETDFINTSKSNLDIVMPNEYLVTSVPDGGKVLIWRGSLNNLRENLLSFPVMNRAGRGGKINFIIEVKPVDGSEIKNIGKLKIEAGTSDSF